MTADEITAMLKTQLEQSEAEAERIRAALRALEPDAPKKRGRPPKLAVAS